MPILDISRPLHAGIPVWPGDTPFALQPVLAIAEGAPVNLTTLTLSAHTGTHADAPYHFDQDGPRIDTLDPAVYWGAAQVVTVQKRTGELLPEDFAHVRLGLAPRLLVRSAASDADPGVFLREIVYPSPALADYLGSLGIVLYGTDAASMDHVESKELPGHHALRRNGIAILEGLDLRHAPDGIYELVALPLKIVGGDGSPVRAVLRTLEPAGPELKG
jgi:arylformamidase